MKLILICEGKNITVNQISQLLGAAGSNTTLSISNAQGRPQAELIPVISAAGSKKIAIDVDASMASLNQTLALFNAANGPNASFALREANGLPPQHVATVFAALGNKVLSAQLNAARAVQEQALNFLNSANGNNTSLTISAVNAYSDQGCRALLGAVGSKRFTAQIPGDQATPAQVLNILGFAGGPNTSIALSNANRLPSQYLSQIFAAAGGKALVADFDVTQMNMGTLKQLIASAGPNTRVSLNTAQATNNADMREILQLAGSRSIDVNLNGAQLNTGQLKATVEAASGNASITVNTAHAASLNEILSAVSASAHTNLTLQYNGAQLVATPTDGNYVVRAIQAAKPGTTIVLNSIGVIQFNMALLLDIIRAAG
ncbi:hypothetical protein [Pseudomonas panipatensis]|uniref:Uncharacterized protein n=1 Tax=Pseudomonas panipatensis TaxID=428992 RepID=A0A1G8FEW3_9PSED|nr:hypothetical protein [Pseudomonas panipatensis]SDH80701.1 hypothetical protein SAMN05216272_103205 [Pseudomonas panipatensis]SMP54111.1 hypothetical protein SAMN06295951_103254 [Pseudomonas panipatensis]